MRGASGGDAWGNCVVTRRSQTDAVIVPGTATRPELGTAHSFRVSVRQGARRHERPITRRKDKKDIEMRTILRSRTSFLAITTVLALTLVVPTMVTAEEQDLALAPESSPTWGVTSGYNALEENRVAASGLIASLSDGNEQALALSLDPGPTWGETSGYNALEANRAIAAQQALLSGDTAGMTWGETSGYNALEANRVAASGLIELPAD